MSDKRYPDEFKIEAVKQVAYSGEDKHLFWLNMNMNSCTGMVNTNSGTMGKSVHIRPE